MMRKQKKVTCILSGCLAVLLLASALLFTGVTAKAEEYDEKNPEFQEARIDSDVEKDYGQAGYYQDSHFQQGDGKYQIKTNAYVAWYTSSDVAMLYRQYNIGSKPTDTLTVELTVDSQTGEPSGLHENASSGIMMCGSVTDPGAPYVYLHTRGNYVMVVYRVQAGNSYALYSSTAPEYPVTLRLEKVGNKYTCSFKNASMSSFSVIGSVASNIAGPIYAGPASHSCDEKVSIISNYSNYSAVGQGSCELSGGEASQEPTKPVIEPLLREDDPIDADITLLKETFSDGTFEMPENSDGIFEVETVPLPSGGQQKIRKVTNPIWKDTFGDIFTNEDRTNRMWLSSYADGTTNAGDRKWTDYTLELDFDLTSLDPQTEDKFIVWTRYREVESTGYYGIGYSIETSVSGPETNPVTKTQIKIYDRKRRNYITYGNLEGTAEIENIYGTGLHHIRIECLDNSYKFFLDGELITFTGCDGGEMPGQQFTTYYDNAAAPNVIGSIALTTEMCEVYVDNILVTKIHDEFGGDYDNMIGANYNDKIPDYLQDAVDKWDIDY